MQEFVNGRMLSRRQGQVFCLELLPFQILNIHRWPFLSGPDNLHGLVSGHRESGKSKDTGKKGKSREGDKR